MKIKQNNKVNEVEVPTEAIKVSEKKSSLVPMTARRTS